MNIWNSIWRCAYKKYYGTQNRKKRMFYKRIVSYAYPRSENKRFGKMVIRV